MLGVKYGEKMVQKKLHLKSKIFVSHLILFSFLILTIFSLFIVNNAKATVDIDDPQEKLNNIRVLFSHKESLETLLDEIETGFVWDSENIIAGSEGFRQIKIHLKYGEKTKILVYDIGLKENTLSLIQFYEDGKFIRSTKIEKNE